MDARDRKAAEAQARASLAEAIKARDAVERRLEKARKAMETQRSAVYDLARQREELEIAKPDAEAERLERLTKLLDADEPISLKRKSDNKGRIQELDEEIAAGDAIVDDLKAIIKGLEDNRADAVRAVKNATQRVGLPTLQALDDRQAKLRAELAEGRRVLRRMSTPEASRELHDAVSRLLNDPFPEDRQALPTLPAEQAWTDGADGAGNGPQRAVAGDMTPTEVAERETIAAIGALGEPELAAVKAWIASAVRGLSQCRTPRPAPAGRSADGRNRGAGSRSGPRAGVTSRRCHRCDARRGRERRAVARARKSCQELLIASLNGVTQMKALASYLLAFGLLAAQTIEADAVVCAKGVYRAGCAGPHGAAVVRHPAAVRHPAPVCRYVVVNGVRVRRCV